MVKPTRAPQKLATSQLPSRKEPTMPEPIASILDNLARSLVADTVSIMRSRHGITWDNRVPDPAAVTDERDIAATMLAV